MKYKGNNFIKNKWIIKGTLFTALMTGMLFSNLDQAYAQTEKINTPQEIATRINPSDNSLTMIEGDTIWNLGITLGINNPMQLLYSNQYKDGDQYQFPVGTKIYFDGEFLEVVNLDGELIGAGTVQEGTIQENTEQEGHNFVVSNNDENYVAEESVLDDYSYSVQETVVPEDTTPEVTSPEQVAPETDPAIQTPESPTSGNINSGTGVAANVFGQLLASERATNDLNALNYSWTIQSATSIRSQELTVSYSHERPSGESIGLLLEQTGAPSSSYGECIAKIGTTGLSETEIANIAFDGWMNSPGHHAILMSSSYTDYAFSYVDNGASTFVTYIAAK